MAQPDSAVTAIILGFSLLPAVLVAASLLVLRGYRLDHDVPSPSGSGSVPEETDAP